MITTLYRIIKHGLQNFWRQRLISVATLTVMLLALLVFSSVLIFNVISTSALNSIQEKIDISVYFKTSSPEDEILRIKGSLEELEEVKNVEYISRDRALEIFKERHSEDSTITQAVDELAENPLSASLNIKAEKPDQYSLIASYLENESLDEYVEKVSYAQNQVVIDRLTSIINVSRQAGLLLTIILAIVAILVVFNTILLAIYSNREGIEIMRLVGASNMFIRGPYLVEGIVYGTLSAILSMAVLFPVVYLVSPYVRVFIPDMNLFNYFVSNIFTLFSYQLLFGIGIGIISSLIAIRRYLKI
jgi:cell division transport system permease protein